MEKLYRLEFISKKPSTLQAKWAALIENSELTNVLGTLSGTFKANSEELKRILRHYESDKEELQIRMEASCQAAYDQDDFDTHSWFKLYPPDAEIATNNERQPIFCEECKRNVGSERTEGKLHLRKIQTDSPISLTSEGDLLLRNDFVRKFKIFENDSDYSFRAVSTPDGKLAWSVVDCAPVASRLNVRRGFCTSCGNATKSDQLPEVEETYILSNDRCFFLSPDLPRLPCFSRGVIEWLIDTSECLSLDDFKPIELVLETPSGSRD